MARTDRFFYKNKKQEKEHVEERYRLLIEDMPALICRFLPDGTLTFVNRSYCDYFKKTKQELLGKNWLDFLPASDKEKAKKHLSTITKENPMVSYEHEVNAADNTVRWQRWFDRAIFDDKGRIVEFQSVGMDITDKMKAEHKIKESEEKYRLLVENANDMILIAQDGYIKFANKKTRNKLGYPEQEIRSKLFTEFIYPDDRKMVIARHRQRLKGKKLPNTYQFRLINDKGEIIWIELSTIVINWAGKPATLNFIRDITQRIKSTEEKLKIQDKLKEYTKKLEIRVKKLEKEKISLTTKEKKVLWGLTAYPYMNDRQLAEKINLKRSTITAIRKRMSDKKIYSTFYMPNLMRLGCDLIAVVYGRFNTEYSERRELTADIVNEPGFVFHHTTDTDFVSIFAAKDLMDCHKVLNRFADFCVKHKIVEETPSVVYFPMKISRISSHFNYASLLHDELDVGIREVPSSHADFRTAKSRLTRNMKEILYVLSKDSKLSTSRIAKMLRLAKPTVRNNINHLIKNGFVGRSNIPELKKLGYKLTRMCHVIFNHDIPLKVREDMIDKAASLPNSSLVIGNEKEMIVMSVFKDFSDESNGCIYKDIKHNDNRVFSDSSSVVLLPYDKTKVFKIDFSGLIKKTFELNDLE